MGDGKDHRLVGMRVQRYEGSKRSGLSATLQAEGTAPQQVFCPDLSDKDLIMVESEQRSQAWMWSCTNMSLLSL